MENTKRPVFNADAAEEYFSDLLTCYRKTANDIFRRDNEGRHASNQTYSAEYQKYVGMQIAMREVLEYFSKYDLDRLRELAEADRDGRIILAPKIIFMDEVSDFKQEQYKEALDRLEKKGGKA